MFLLADCYARLAATATAVAAFARNNHTPRTGNYRSQLTRAVQWLTQQALPDPADRALVAWALAEVARTTGREDDEVRAREARQELPRNLPGLAGAVADRACGRTISSSAPVPSSCSSEEELQALALAALSGEGQARAPVLRKQITTGREAGQISLGGVDPAWATAWGAVILSLTSNA